MSRKYGAPIDSLAGAGAEIRRRSRRARGRARRDRRDSKPRRARARQPIARGARAVSARSRGKRARAGSGGQGRIAAAEARARANSGSSSTRDEGLAAPSGYDRAEFLVRTNPGSRPGPLMKVASGGELARFLLAIKVCLAERGTAPTLVFDEIDAGVGGAVADAMGQRLARLAARAQVLAVTHAPQVAARAQSHLPDRQERRRSRASASSTSVARLGGGRAARGDRPHAGRRASHPRGARGRREPDREGGMNPGHPVLFARLGLLRRPAWPYQASTGASSGPAHSEGRS